MTRCIRVGMQRKPKGAAVERFSGNWHRTEGAPLVHGLVSALMPRAGSLLVARPVLPSELGDRAWDIWEPLIAIADEAGGRWPDRARAACLHFATGSQRRSELTLPELVIRDVFTLYEEFKATDMKSDVVQMGPHDGPPLVDDEHVSSQALVVAMCQRDEWPYGDLRRGFNVHRLARILEPFEIKPTKFRHKGTAAQARGYRWADFQTEWSKLSD